MAREAQSIIRLLVVLLFLGCIMIWIMMPTNTFNLKWLPKIHGKTDPTYFGAQGLFSIQIFCISLFVCLRSLNILCWLINIMIFISYHIILTVLISGETILMYTFPVLLIATLGCVYLHIAKKSSNESNIEM